MNLANAQILIQSWGEANHECPDNCQRCGLPHQLGRKLYRANHRTTAHPELPPVYPAPDAWTDKWLCGSCLKAVNNSEGE